MQYLSSLWAFFSASQNTWGNVSLWEEVEEELDRYSDDQLVHTVEVNLTEELVEGERNDSLLFDNTTAQASEQKSVRGQWLNVFF